VLVKKRLGFALLGLVAVAAVACGHDGAVTSTLPTAPNSLDPSHSASGAVRPTQVGSPTPQPSASPTLYVSGTERVVSFPLTAAGSPAPVRTLFVHRLQQDGIVGIATNADTTLDVLQDFRNSSGGPSTPSAPGNWPDCRVIVYPATASGDAAAMNQFSCFHSAVGPGQPIGGVRGLGIARGVSGAVDYLEAALPATSPPPSPSPQPGDYVQRSNESGSDNGLLTISTPSAKVHNGMAEGAGGHIYVSYSVPFGTPIPAGSGNGQCTAGATSKAAVDNYAVGVTGNALPVKTITINGRVSAGALATYPVADQSRRLYVATCDANAFSWVDEMLPEFSSGATSPNKSIGPFTDASVTALAVDAQGNIYVGLTNNPVSSSSGNAVRVYGPNFQNGSKLPMRSIDNPLPLPSFGNQKITGLAITQ
jgi:hypothetical protein